jgi:hypothetical protein
MTTGLEQEIDQTREHLGATVDALTAKADAGKKRAGIGALVGVALIVALVIWKRRG